MKETHKIYWIWVDEDDPEDRVEYRDIPIMTVYYDEYDYLVFYN